MAAFFYPLKVIGTQPKPIRRYLAGKTLMDAQGCARLVLVQDRMTLQILGGTWSNAETGEYLIDYLPDRPEEGLLVTSIDITGGSNAEVLDHVSLCEE